MAEDAAGRTEPASRARRERALAAGVLAPSRTLLAAAAVFGALVSLRLTWPATAVSLQDLMRGAVTGRLSSLPAWGPRFAHVLVEALVAVLGGAAAAVLMVGLWATRGRLKVPSRGAGGRGRGIGASLLAAMVALLSALMLAAVTASLEVRRLGALMAHAAAMPLPRLAGAIGDAVGSWANGLLAALGLVIAVEIFRHEHRRREALFVTPREAREQAREDEGAPLLRSARQARQREAQEAIPPPPGRDA
ncbi:MAG TPA: EscU/YscU/HrcU family type III secretion system export apparatus switch protein [Polyangia bacterium]